MNFCTPKLMSHLKLAGECYGPVLPLMGDGVQKIVVHNEWILMFWGFTHRRFVQDCRENRQTFVPVMLTLTPAESSAVVVAVKKVSCANPNANPHTKPNTNVTTMPTRDTSHPRACHATCAHMHSQVTIDTSHFFFCVCVCARHGTCPACLT